MSTSTRGVKPKPKKPESTPICTLSLGNTSGFSISFPSELNHKKSVSLVSLCRLSVGTGASLYKLLISGDDRLIRRFLDSGEYTMRIVVYGSGHAAILLSEWCVATSSYQRSANHVPFVFAKLILPYPRFRVPSARLKEPAVYGIVVTPPPSRTFQPVV